MPVNFLDIVATQGAYLVPRTGTPVSQKIHDKDFAALLSIELRALVTEQIYRRNMYHEAADEWPIGRTPPELKEKRKAEVKALEEREGASDSIDSDNNTDDADGRVDLEKGVAISSRPQPHWLPTPPLSADGHTLAQNRAKRRRVSSEDKADDEKRRSTKELVPTSSTTMRIRPAETHLADGSQGNARKRRRIHGVDDEQVEAKKRPARTYVTAPRTSKRLQALQATQLRRSGNGPYHQYYNKAIKYSEKVGAGPTAAPET